MLQVRSPSSDNRSPVAVVTLLGKEKKQEEGGQRRRERGNETSMQCFGGKSRDNAREFNERIFTRHYI